MPDSGSISNILTISGIIVGCLTAFYIAHRQGAFRRPFLYVSCGSLFPAEKEERWQRKYFSKGRKPVWAIFYGVPNKKVGSYVVIVPFVFKNKCDNAIKNIFVQISCPLELDPSGLLDAKDIDTNGHVMGIKGKLTRFGGKLQCEVSIPVLSPQSHIMLYLPIAIEKQLFKKEKGAFATKALANCKADEFIVAKIDCYVSTEG